MTLEPGAGGGPDVRDGLIVIGCEYWPYTLEGDGPVDARLREGASQVSAGRRGRRLSQAATRSRSASTGSAGSAASARSAAAAASLALLPFSVGLATARKLYLPKVRLFLEHLRDRDLIIVPARRFDDALCDYFGYLAEARGLGPHWGDHTVAGLVFVWPELAGTLPRSQRAVKAWHRMSVDEEGQPVPLEIWEVIIDELKGRSARGAADFVAVSLDCYLRGGEAEKLTTDDVIISTGANGETVVSIRLGVPERNERTKTGQRQGVIVDRPHVAALLISRKKELGPGCRLFGVSVDQVRHLLASVGTQLGIDIGPAHSVRHSGPAHDLWSGYRTLWHIQRRGRWVSERSVMRYAKTHSLLEARARFPAALMDRGGQLLRGRPARPMTARE